MSGPPRSARSPLPVVLLTIFLDMVGYGILIPVIPLLLADPSAPSTLLPVGRAASHGYVLLGLLIAVFPLAQFAAAPVLGQLSDRYGRKPVLTFSLAGTLFSHLLFGLGIVARSIPLLFLARFLDGATGGNVAVAQAAIADVTPPQNRTKNFGLIGAAFGLGFIIGPFLGGKLSDAGLLSWFDAATPFWFAAGLSLLNVASVLFFFSETHANPIPGLRMDWLQSAGNILRAFNLKGLRALYASVFLFHSGFSFFTTFLSVFLITRFGFDQPAIGNFFAYVGVWVIFTQAVVTRAVSRRYGERRVLRVSLLTCGCGILLYFLPTSAWQLFFVVPFFATFNGLSQANLVGLVSRSVDASVQGEVLGINASVQALAQSIPPVLAGFLAAAVSPSFPIVMAAGTILLSGLVFVAFQGAKEPV